MKIALTGATGLVGQFLARGLSQSHHDVVTLGRSGAAIGFDLDQTPPDLGGFDVLVHAGFAHVPGRYRGGEGNDPEGFVRRNQNGSIRLFESATRDGVTQLVFLSSRAVYGDYPAGTALTETLPPRPDTLYGEVKHAVELALPEIGRASVVLRATGVYGPGPAHKWRALFEDFQRGAKIAPRIGTEVHGEDLASALLLALGLSGHRIWNVSDLVLDRHDLLAEVNRLAGTAHRLPERAKAVPNVMSCEPLRQLGWHPGGWEKLRATLPALLV